MKLTGTGKLSDGSVFEVPVYQNGIIFHRNKQQVKSVFIKGKKSFLFCNILRVENMIDLDNILKKYGTIELRSTIYDNIPFNIWLKKKRGLRHRLNLFFRNMLQESLFIQGTIESLTELVKPGTAVEIRLTRWGVEISTKDV